MNHVALQAIMRHKSIATTMGYYVDLDQDEVADIIWAVSSQEVPRKVPKRKTARKKRSKKAA